MDCETFMGLMQDVLLLTLEQRAQLKTRLDAQERSTLLTPTEN